MSEDFSPRAGVAERVSRMIQLPTVSADSDERGAAPFDAFIALLAELYPLVHEQLERETHTDRGLLFHWRGRGDGADGPVVLMAHFDVVPADPSERWTHPPFDGRIADGWVYGRGALDDKGPLAVILEAVENLLATGFTPARDVYLSFGGNEETTGAAAIAIADAFVDRAIVPWLVLDEGGAVVETPLPFVRGQVAMVGVAEKDSTTLRLSARGEGGHAGIPPAMTAVRRVARAVDRLGPRTFRPRTPTTVTGMLHGFAARAAAPARWAYHLLAAMPPLTARLFAAVGGEPAAFVRTTVAATMQSGGTAANVLPSEASAIVNLRIALGETVHSTVRRVKRRIGDRKVDVEVIAGSDPTAESPSDNAQFALIAAAVAASHPGAATVPYLMMQASDARHFHRRFPAVYRLAPIEMSAAQRSSIHGVDERVEIAALRKGERFHRELLLRLG